MIKKVTVLKLAGTAAAASTAITLIPGDAAMPIADQIAELTPIFHNNFRCKRITTLQ